jgi:hypothetical protein
MHLVTPTKIPIEDEVACALSDLHFHLPMTQSPMLSVDQFQDLLSCVTDTLKAKKDDNPFSWARLESYISNGLTFQFNGSENKLILWMKKFLTL